MSSEMESKEPPSVAEEQKPTGVKFTYGIPGRDGVKNHIDMPPRPTTTAPVSRGRGRGGRGQPSNASHYIPPLMEQQPYGRGGGTKSNIPRGAGNGSYGRGGRGGHDAGHTRHVPAGHWRGGHSNGARQQQSYNPNPLYRPSHLPFSNNNNNNSSTHHNPYVKINKVSSKPKTYQDKNNNNVEAKSPVGGCGVCDRPCVDVVCKGCGYHGKNLRVRKDCPLHPKVIRMLDLKVCPECKKEEIEERAENDKKVEDLKLEDLKLDQEETTTTAEVTVTATA